MNALVLLELHDPDDPDVYDELAGIYAHHAGRPPAAVRVRGCW